MVGVAVSFFDMMGYVLRESYFCMAKIILLTSSRVQWLCCVATLWMLGLGLPAATHAKADDGSALASWAAWAEANVSPVPVAGGVSASASAAVGPVRVSASAPAATSRWLNVPRVFKHITARELGLVINLADPYSVEVGEYYRQVRNIPAEHVLKVNLPRKPQLDSAELDQLRDQVARHFDEHVQALALAWVEPWSVTCQSITSALSLGLEPGLCSNTCGPARLSPLFNSASGAPWHDHGVRPTMLLAAPDFALARSLIDRGVAADHTLGLLGRPPVHVWFMSTHDAARNVRAAHFPPPGLIGRPPLQVHVEQGDLPRDSADIVLLQTGLPRLNAATVDSLGFVPGALADHLTSYGGRLTEPLGQTSALSWISAGATASYGTVSEPCNHLQKFPHPQVLLLHYAQGASALEAYWKSVAWPAQGVFIGDPLAAPFAR
jgi:uncharacterized protein (TIGR03790 family)